MQLISSKCTVNLRMFLIQELKGNIRVFCRVRPLLSEDGVGAEANVVSFPSSMEAQGRGIDLAQNGEYVLFLSHLTRCYLYFCRVLLMVIC